MIPVFLFGGYRDRQPLAYYPIRSRLGDRIALVETPQDAQIIVISHYNDFDFFGPQIRDMLVRHPRLRLVMLSEEPFWDSIWMPDPLTRIQRIELADGGSVVCQVLNHHTSQIFRAARVPYFLLTDPRYISHYRQRLDRNAGFRATDWDRQFREAPLDAAFVGIRRTGPLLNPAYPEAQIWALSAYRTVFTERASGARLIRQGAGWSDDPARQDLSDWHDDKLSRFDLRCRYMSAFENTHQPHYVSEKIFDAFAIGSVPLYYASARHDVHRLLGAEGWLNFFDDDGCVPHFDAQAPVSPALCAAYAQTQDRIAKCLLDDAVIEQEYERLCESLLRDLTQALCAALPAP